MQKKFSRLFGKKMLAVSLTLIGLGAVWGSYRFAPRRPADIFVVAPLQYGDTILEGFIKKDSALGAEGDYYLVTAAGQHIRLDVQGIDSMVDREVNVSGYLTPAPTSTELPYLIVSSLETR